MGVPSSFTDGIEPRPEPAHAYQTNFAGRGAWSSVEIGPQTVAGMPNRPILCEAGKPFTIQYNRSLADLSLPGKLHTIRLHYQIDGGPIQTTILADGTVDPQTQRLVRSPAEIPIPLDARGEVVFWFELSTVTGQTHYDSQFGHNFHADIVPRGGAKIRFDELWGESVKGTIRAGEALRLLYDTDRVKQFLYETWHHGVPTWSVSAFVSFDDKDPVELPITAITHGTMGQYVEVHTFAPSIEVPPTAKKVSIWFRGSSYGGSITGGPAWDSNYGVNYNFAVAPPRS